MGRGTENGRTGERGTVGPELITDPAEAAQVRHQARAVHAKAVAAAVVLTAIALLL